MGNRRIGRARLYAVEKAGRKFDPEAAPGIKDAIKSASQHRNGQEIISEIVLDLGVDNSIANIVGGGTAGDVIGVASQVSYITQLTVAKYGIITEIRGVVVEEPSFTNIDIITDDAGSGGTVTTAGTPAGNTTIVVDGLTAKGNDISNSNPFHANMQDSDEAFLYLVNGNGQGSGAALDAGKIIIYIYGVEVPADI
tara:strand:- start:1671 stop:2258 length:588 start_codon:yes stop_codon:yes gene_type:complete